MTQKAALLVDSISRHEVQLLSRVLVETRAMLKKTIAFLEQYLQVSEALDENSKKPTTKTKNTFGKMAGHVKEASWKCMGMELPMGHPNPQTISLLTAIYGDEVKFNRMTDSLPEDFQDLLAWGREFHNLLALALERTIALYSALTPVKSSGKLDAVRDGSDIVNEAPLNDSKALAGNPKSSHPISPMPGRENVKHKRSPEKSPTQHHYKLRSEAPSKTPTPKQIAKEWKTKILIVDDEVGVGIIIQDFIKHLGYLPRLVSNGAEALACLEKESFGAVLSDYKMTAMSGVELYETIRRRYPGLAKRFIFITGRSSEEPAKTGCPVLMKPVSLKDLKTALRGLLEPAK